MSLPAKVADHQPRAASTEAITAERFIARDHLVLSLARKVISSQDSLQNNDEFLAELDTLIYDISRTHTAIETAQRECATYADMHKRYTEQIESITTEIELLRVQLKEAHETKGRYDQYRLLAQAYKKLPSRQESADRIEKAEEEIKHLSQLSDHLERCMDRTRKDVTLLFGAVTSLTTNRKQFNDLAQESPTNEAMELEP